MSVESQIKDIVVDIVHCDEAVLAPTSTWEDLKADSLDLVQVLIAIEDTFDIEIPDEDAQNFQNYGDFVAYVEARVAEKSSA